LVQAANGGTVTNILVKENQVVKKGQTIALIDPFQLQIKKSQIIGKIQQAKQQLVQLNTQIKALDGQIAAESETHKGLIASASAELSREQRNYTEKKATSTADAITPESNQKASFTPYYEVTIEPERLYLEKDNKQYPIQPGMEVVANIISKEETVLTFLLRKARLLSNVGV
ncbi:MAG: biotin/lipoyl-binding protein, partial [Stigonema ocellatum SAG 48.90 = DSM 106950]|nr:biotin/lipoyl-binding protein [Stigonema ocellatum SAG 48.90 = DSM 106950]